MIEQGLMVKNQASQETFGICHMCTETVKWCCTVVGSMETG